MNNYIYIHGHDMQYVFKYFSHGYIFSENKISFIVLLFC